MLLLSRLTKRTLRFVLCSYQTRITRWEELMLFSYCPIDIKLQRLICSTTPGNAYGIRYVLLKHNLHFISDEIFTLSIFSNSAIPDPTPFTSTLALDLRT
ncbi:hypothetical protein BJX64DRAFT_44435 [Aspergillus heterothallicus]